MHHEHALMQHDAMRMIEDKPWVFEYKLDCVNSMDWRKLEERVMANIGLDMAEGLDKAVCIRGPKKRDWEQRNKKKRRR
jgi:hypothetical protein